MLEHGEQPATTSACATMKVVPSALGVIHPARTSSKLPTTHRALPAITSHEAAVGTIGRVATTAMNAAIGNSPSPA